MNSYNIDITAVSENAVLLEWPEVICEMQHQHILLCKQQILAQYSDKIIDVIASYNSLMVYYHFEQLPLSSFISGLSKITQMGQGFQTVASAENALLSPVIIDIPVCYHPSLGIDIEEVARQTNCTIAQVIKLHSDKVYNAFALGFTPGFCYLATLAKKLHLSRRENPRIAVPAGAVAIAEQQTAVYPTNSPGGWHIIGQTPIAMYQASSHEFEPTVSVGQQVRFVPISLDDYHNMAASR